MDGRTDGDGLEALELQLQSTDRDDPVFAGPGPIGLKADLLLTELGLREFSESRFFRIPFLSYRLKLKMMGTLQRMGKEGGSQNQS